MVYGFLEGLTNVHLIQWRQTNSVVNTHTHTHHTYTHTHTPHTHHTHTHTPHTTHITHTHHTLPHTHTHTPTHTTHTNHTPHTHTHTHTPHTPHTHTHTTHTQTPHTHTTHQTYHTHTHTHTPHTHKWCLMPSKYGGHLFIVQVVRLKWALHTWCFVLRNVHYAFDPHGGCRHFWVEYLHRTFLRHSKAVNSAWNVLENVDKGDLPTCGTVESYVLSKYSRVQLASR